MSMFVCLNEEQQPDSEALLKCKCCAEEFWVDACTEENLILDKTKKLRAKCPKCGVIDV